MTDKSNSSGFSSYVTISDADFERWKRIKTQYQDINPGLLEVSNLQSQIAAVQKERDLSDSEKFRIRDNLEVRIEEILKSLPVSLGIRRPKAAASKITEAGEKSETAEDETKTITEKDEDLDLSDLPPPPELVDLRTYRKTLKYFGGPKKMGIPHKHHQKYRELLQHISDNRDKIGVETGGRIVLNGDIIDQSNAGALLASMFTEKKSLTTEGLAKFVDVLWDTELDDRIFASNRVRGHLNRQGLRVDKSSIFQEPSKIEETGRKGIGADPDEKDDDEDDDGNAYQSLHELFPEPGAASSPNRETAPLPPPLPPSSRALRIAASKQASAKKQQATVAKAPTAKALASSSKVPPSKAKGKPTVGKQSGQGMKRVRLAKPSDFPPGKRRRNSDSDSSVRSVKSYSSRKPKAPLVLRLYR